jgi:hypothetical protein
MGGNKLISFIMQIALLVTFLGLINMIFNLHGIIFIFEFIVLLGLLLAGFITAIGITHNMRWAWVLLMLFFGFVLLDMLFIKAITTAEIVYFKHLIFIAVAGFFISLFSIKKEEVIGDNEKKVVKAGKTITAKKTFTPGKFIASKTGVKYHAPKCDWAKKIKKSNAVWFDSKEAAKKAGYKKDACVK